MGALKAPEVAMESWMMIAIGAAIVGLLLIALVAVERSRRRKHAAQTARLRKDFGPEYAHTVTEQGRSIGEEDLKKRHERASELELRALSADEVARYNASWTATQSQFVADPGAALNAASQVVNEVVAARGYPAGDFERSASALSVDHPRAVQDYRAAHGVMLQNQRNPAATDDLRAAMTQFQAVFTELMDGRVTAANAA